MTKKKKTSHGMWLKAGIIILVVGASAVWYIFFTGMSAHGGEEYVTIDTDDNADSVMTKVSRVATAPSMMAFKLMSSVTGYDKKIHTGRYLIGSKGALMTFRNFAGGHQAPLMLTIPTVRTKERLAEELSKRMMVSKQELLTALNDSVTCKAYGYRPETILCMFIPNTYDMYWDCHLEDLLKRMEKECKRFWTPMRREKAKAAGLTEEEVVTLASIVDEETANNSEKPMIAGMYINRLREGMLLQADPTVKFALGKFELRRIYHNMLNTDSPYNTYRYKGLPPGPIRIPTISAIDAVLDYTHHDYLFMCAKEDLSGTHNFAKTYEEHQQNANKYVKALNERGIK